MLLLDWLADFLVRPTSPPSCLTIFIGYHSLLGYNTRFSHRFTARILVKLPGIYVTLFACLPLPSLFVRYARLTVMISMSRERGLLWLRHEPLQSLALALEPTPSFYSIHFINWFAKCVFSFSQDCFLLSGSLALEALLIGVHCKKRYINL